jgi:hypothetical protein
MWVYYLHFLQRYGKNSELPPFWIFNQVELNKLYMVRPPKQVLRSTILSSTIKIAWLRLRFGLRSTKSKKE